MPPLASDKIRLCAVVTEEEILCILAGCSNKYHCTLNALAHYLITIIIITSFSQQLSEQQSHKKMFSALKHSIARSHNWSTALQTVRYRQCAFAFDAQE